MEGVLTISAEAYSKLRNKPLSEYNARGVVFFKPLGPMEVYRVPVGTEVVVDVRPYETYAIGTALIPKK